MGGYLVQDAQTATGNMKAIHTAVRNMTHIVKSAGHKVSMDKSFSFPTVFDYQRDQKNKCVQGSATQTKRHALQTLTEKTN
jgi:hypothetical protein